jgi:hypothetical protein
MSMLDNPDGLNQVYWFLLYKKYLKYTVPSLPVISEYHSLPLFLERRDFILHIVISLCSEKNKRFCISVILNLSLDFNSEINNVISQ